MQTVLTRRTALVAMASFLVSGLPGCGAAPILARVPWRKIIKIIILILTNGAVVAELFGEDTDGKEQQLELTITKEQLEEIQRNGSVTIELKDGSKKRISPTINKGE